METAFLKMVNDKQWSMEHQHVTALMAMDLSVAFDTVDHGILLSALKNKYKIVYQALQ